VQLALKTRHFFLHPQLLDLLGLDLLLRAAGGALKRLDFLVKRAVALGQALEMGMAAFTHGGPPVFLHTRRE